MSISIEIRNLTASFPIDKKTKLKVINNISLKVKNGETLAILGPSGCGKTTLIKIIAGFIKANKGNVFFEQKPIEKISKDGSIGYVPQNCLPIPFLTVKENLLLPLRITKNKNISRANLLLSTFDLEKFSNYYPHQLSGGMNKKLSLARSLVTNPKILLMDEPFASLDNITKEKMNEDFINWKNNSNPTVIFVTHDIEEAVFVSDRIIFLSKRPATILKKINVKLPKLRSRDIKSSKHFLKIVNNARLIVNQIT